MFLIQVGEDGLPMFDFQYELIDALKQQAWLENGPQDYALVKSVENGLAYVCAGLNEEGIALVKRDYIPVGSIEFVNAFLRELFHSEIQAFNVPKSIFLNNRFTGRLYYKNQTPEQVLYLINEFKLMTFFVKDARRPKTVAELCSYSDKSSYEFLTRASDDERYDVSYYLSEEHGEGIVAEYRIFASGNVIWDVRKYLGDWYQNYHVDKEFVRDLVLALDKDDTIPRDKVIDIGVLEDGKNILLEMHSFISCGLYGFTSNSLPRIMRRAYLWQADNPPEWLQETK